MNSQISVPIPTGQFLDLVAFLREEGDVRDPVEVVSFAIQYFLDNASWKQDDLLVTQDSRGYQWKNLFLPRGTQVRMQYKGQYFYAKVEGDQLLYDGAPTSPSALANKITSSSRNAWRDLWIKRPQDKEWKLAADLRQELNPIDPDRALQEFLGSPKTATAGGQP